MKRALVLWLCMAAFIGSSRAQTNAPGVPERRVLFIIETSRETKSSAEAQRDLVSTLIASGMADLIVDGDTIGIWTFNEKVYTGQMPMQRWSASSAQEIADRATAFLKLVRYEKAPSLQPIMKPLSAVIRNSSTLTIVMVTSSRTPMVGTPYDMEIHAYFKEHERAFHKKKIPFVTMLLTRRGQVVRYTVGPGVGDVKIPKPLPEEPKPVAVATAPPKETAPVEKRSDKALVITKSGAVKTTVEQADEIASAAKIQALPASSTPQLPPVELPKNEIPNLPPGSAIVTSVVNEKYLVKSPTNTVLLEKTQTGQVPQDGVVPDAATAIQIAEAVLTPIHGKATLEKEKPLTATLENGIWTVKGSLRGIAIAEISRADGRVLRVSHGK